MKKGDPSGQRYNFRGQKAEIMARRLAFMKKHPELVRDIMDGKRVKGYPMPEYPKASNPKK